LGPSTDPENFRSWNRCPTMLWKPECCQFYLAMYLNELSFWHWNISIFKIRQCIFEEFWNLVSFVTLYRPWKFQILKGMPYEVMEGWMYSIFFCCVFKCIKFLTLKHSYLSNSSMYIRDILEFSIIWHRLQTLKIPDAKADDPRCYGRLNVVNFTLPCIQMH